MSRTRLQVEYNWAIEFEINVKLLNKIFFFLPISGINHINLSNQTY